MLHFHLRTIQFLLNELHSLEIYYLKILLIFVYQMDLYDSIQMYLFHILLLHLLHGDDDVHDVLHVRFLLRDDVYFLRVHGHDHARVHLHFLLHHHILLYHQNLQYLIYLSLLLNLGQCFHNLPLNLNILLLFLILIKQKLLLKL